MDSLKSYTHGPASGSKPEQLVILLHGLGADGQDLIGLAPILAEFLPHAVFVSPDAPYRCDMAPMGYQWFSLQEWTTESILRGVQQAAPVLDSFITGQIEDHGVTAAKTALLGFSQGSMMSLYAGPRYPEKLAGVVGFSGALIWEDNPDLAALHKIPIHLVHGDADTVVPPSAYQHAREALEVSGFTVTGGMTPGLAHNIDEAGIKGAAAFLKRVLG